MGAQKTRLDWPSFLALAVLAGAFIAPGAMFATTVLAGADGALPFGPVSLRGHSSDIKTKIEDALTRHAQKEAQAIRVTVRDGNKVLLEGKVGSWDEREAVESAAWSAAGVQTVDDRLTIVR